MKTSNFRVQLAMKEVREGRNISLRDVANETGISIYTVSGFANSTLKALPVDALESLCVYLDCTPNDLLTIEDARGNDLPSLAAA